MHALFVYGTLVEPERQQTLLGRLCPLTEAVLKGYRRYSGRWPYIMAAAGESVAASVMTNLSDDDLAKFDAYEEVPGTAEPALYERIMLDVRLGNGHITPCWVYVPLLTNWNPAWLEGKA